MRKIKDNAGREWELVVNAFPQAYRLKKALGFDILEGVPALLSLAQDAILRQQVLYALCKQQCEAEKVSDEDFGAAMTGDAAAEASRLLMEEIVDFFPQCQRASMLSIVTTMDRLQNEVATLAAEKIGSQEFQKAMTAIVEQAQAEIEAAVSNLTGPGSSEPSEQQESTLTA